MNIKNCAIYTRVSTDNQAEKEFSSCEAQEQKIRSFIASQNNWQVFKIYNDAGFSGATLERPALQELLSDLKKEKIDVVLVYKIDRLTRSPKDFYQLIEFFETYIESGSTAKTYQMLKDKQVKNKLGKNFSKTNISHILRNVIYIGKILHNGEVYQGIHKPIISEEIFALAQKIHKEKQRNFRVYKNFLFGGLIKCEECGSNMTSCFTNKCINGKLNRYYYYRCTATMKQDWQACSVKQVSAERLENFCLENLERISIDKNYIENLIFRLNTDTQVGHRTGYELTDGCSKFSTENISDTLKFFINGLKITKGIERNLFAKKFLSNIFYSPESIKIRFISRQNEGVALAERSPAPPLAGLGERTLSSSKSEFVSSFLAPQP